MCDRKRGGDGGPEGELPQREEQDNRRQWSDTEWDHRKRSDRAAEEQASGWR